MKRLFFLSPIVVLSFFALLNSPTSYAANKIHSNVEIRGYKGKCLDVRGPSSVNGTPVQLWDCVGVPQQHWDIYDNGEIRSKLNTRKCLDLRGPSNNNGARVQIWDCVGVLNQQWQFSYYQSLRSLWNNKCLDVRGPSSANGTPIQMWNCVRVDNQKFYTSGVTVTPFGPDQNLLNQLRINIALIKACQSDDRPMILCNSKGFQFPFIERAIAAVMQSEIGITPGGLLERAETACSISNNFAHKFNCVLLSQLGYNLWQYRLEVATVSVLNRVAFELMPGGKCIEVVLKSEIEGRLDVLDSVDCVAGIAGSFTSNARPAIRMVVIGADAFANCLPLIEALEKEGSIRTWDSAWNTFNCTSVGLDIASQRLQLVRSVRNSGTLSPAETVRIDDSIREIDQRIAMRREYLNQGRSVPGGSSVLQDILNDLHQLEQDIQAIPTVYKP